MDKEQLAKEFVLKQSYLKKGAYLTSEELYEVNVASFISGYETASQQVIKGKIEVLEEMRQKYIDVKCSLNSQSGTRFADRDELRFSANGIDSCIIRMQSKITELKTQLENEQDNIS